MRKTIILIILMLLSPVVFADAEVTSTSSSTVTNTDANPDVISDSENTTTKTTVTKTTTTTVEDDTDAVIVAAIYSRYAKSSALIGTALSVASEKGVVTIDGNVTAQSQADEAVALAATIPGVKIVKSSIIVTTNDATSQPSPPSKHY